MGCHALLQWIFPIQGSNPCLISPALAGRFVLASLVAQIVKPPAKETGLIPGLRTSLGEGMATHSSILAWRIPWREEPGGLQSVGLHRVGHA